MRHLAPLFSALLLSACAGTLQVGPAAPDRDPVVIGPGTGEVPANTITVHRAANFGLATNALTNPALVFDGRSVGTCRVGAPLVVRVPDGTWTIEALTESGRAVQSVEVSGGVTRHLRCGTEATPSVAPRPVLVPASAEEAAREAGL